MAAPIRRNPRKISSGDMAFNPMVTNVPRSGYNFGRSKKKGEKKQKKTTEQYKATRNERAKAQYRAKQIKSLMDASQSPVAKQRLQSQLDNLNKVIDSTYTYSRETGKKVRDSKEVARNVQQLSRTNEQLSRDLGIGSYRKTQRQRNKATMIEINKASIKETEAESRYTKAQTKIFYRATLEAWKDHSNYDDRNRLILEYYGETDLADFFNRVVNDESNVMIQRAIDIMQDPDATKKELEWARMVLQEGDNDDNIRYLAAPGGATTEDISPVAPMA